MTDELLNKANELTIKIKKLDVSIERVEDEIRYKKRFDEDIIQGKKPIFFKSYLKSFASVFFDKDKKPSIRGHVECRYPVEIELEDEEFCVLLLEYLKNKKRKLSEEFNKL